jgi:hypothetical protein
MLLERSLWLARLLRHGYSCSYGVLGRIRALLHVDETGRLGCFNSTSMSSYIGGIYGDIKIQTALLYMTFGPSFVT